MSNFGETKNVGIRLPFCFWWLNHCLQSLLPFPYFPYHKIVRTFYVRKWFTLSKNQIGLGCHTFIKGRYIY